MTYMTLAKFKTLSNRDWENGAVRDEIYSSIKRMEELQDFAIWMTGCGYDFCQHGYFCQQRDLLLKDG